MKKKILLGVGVLLLGGLALFGRDLLGIYYLMEYIDSSTTAYEADGPWPQLADSCGGCHGKNGSSLHQRYPSLAGQPADYLTAQLHSFASGQRKYPNMEPLAMSLSASEIEQLATHFARQPAQENRGFEPDPALQKRGEKLAAAGACTACHGAQLLGQAQVPRLAGQGHQYLQVQLDAFAEGRRVDPTGSMKAVTANLSADDRKALAQYLAAIVPAPQTP